VSGGIPGPTGGHNKMQSEPAGQDLGAAFDTNVAGESEAKDLDATLAEGP
jgi:hypothetical protein